MIQCEVEILSDGRTVWVNSSEGVSIGRFSKMGIDVHKDGKEQMESDKHCLFCRPGPTTLKDWNTFKQKIEEHYSVIVTDEHCPKFLQG